MRDGMSLLFRVPNWHIVLLLPSLLLTTLANTGHWTDGVWPPPFPPHYLTHLDSVLTTPRVDRAQRLAIVSLWVISPNRTEISLHGDLPVLRLRCNLEMLAKHVVPNTTLDALIFSRFHRGFNGTLTSPLNASVPGFHYPWLHFLPFMESQWVFPQWLPQPQDGFQYYTNGHDFENYKLMGQWRILYAFHLAAKLGYEYALMLDDDFFVAKPIGYDLLANFKEHQWDMAAQRDVIGEELELTWGLAELAQYFLVQERMEPAGPLFQHCNPHNMSGLVSGRYPDPNFGFDRYTMVTNFLLVRIQFWMQPKVQEFIRLAVMSGGLARRRWQEQAVASMLRLMFVSDARFHTFGLEHMHDKHPDTIGKLCPGIDLSSINMTIWRGG